MHYYQMKQHAAAAYLQLVLGCDRVVYGVNWFNDKDYPIDLIGLRGEELAISVDLAEKFSGHPKEMKQRTLKRKLIDRYQQIYQGLQGSAKSIQIELWYFGTAPERVETAMPDVLTVLHEQLGVEVHVVSSKEVKERLHLTQKRLAPATWDYGNPFLQALLISAGTLDRPRTEAAHMPKEFPVELPNAFAIPQFVEAFLESKYVVNWLDFDVSAFDSLKDLANENPSGVWKELRHHLSMDAYEEAEGFLGSFLEAEEDEELEEDEEFEEDEELEEDEFDEDEEFDEWMFGEEEIMTRYTLSQIVRTLESLVQNAAKVLREWRSSRGGALIIDIEYMLPFVFKHPRLAPELIEAEIVRFGGDRDLVRAHMQNPSPDKRFYRGTLYISFANRDEEVVPHRNNIIVVPIRNPRLREGVKVAVWFQYQPEFAGYFHMTFEALAPHIRLALEK